MAKSSAKTVVKQTARNKNFHDVKDKLRFINKHLKEPELFEDLKQLYRAKGFTQVEVTHGNKEFGKDLVFKTINTAFDEEKWFGVVVKNKNATQNDFMPGGEIAVQIDMAFKVPYKSSKGEEHKISSVFVVINGSVTDNAREVLKHTVSPLLLEHIKIFNYQLLAEEIEGNIKELFMSNIEPIVNVFANTQTQKLSDIRNTNDLFDLKINDIDDIFVNVNTTYSQHIKKVEKYVSYENGKETSTKKEDVDGVNEILDSTNNFVIHGIATCGKSLLLRRLGLKAIAAQKRLLKAVFFLEIPEIIDGKKPVGKRLQIEEAMYSQFSEYTDGEAFVEADYGSILLLIDSLDEVRNKELRIELIKEIAAFSKDNKFAKIQIVLTTRTIDVIENENLLEGYEFSELLPFNLGQALSLVKKVIPDNKAKSNAFVDSLKNSFLSSNLIRTPLALTIMATLYRDDKIDLKELPANITELYDKFVDTYLERWDASKGISDQYKYEQIKLIIAYIAYEMHENNSSMATSVEINDYLTELRKEFSYDELDDISAFIEHLKYKNGVFTYNAESDTFMFYNQYFQEFFVSLSINDENEDDLKTNFFSDWWENSLVFYCGKEPRRYTFLKDVSKNVIPISSADKYSYLTLMSKCLQASHSIKIANRIEIIKKLVFEFDSFYELYIKEGLEGKNPSAALTTMDLILNFRKFFDGLFNSKFIANSDNVEGLIALEELLKDEKENLSEVTRYCMSYFSSYQSGTPNSLNEFIRDEEMGVIWTRIIYVDLNFLNMKNQISKDAFNRIKKRMNTHKFKIQDNLKSSSVENLAKQIGIELKEE